VLDACRARGEGVIHVQHVWDAAEASFMRPGTAGVEIHERVAPHDDEPVVRKAHPNAFLDTTLEQELRARGVDHVVVCGMMTSMCVDATVRAAVDLGFRATIVHDACAAPDLEFAGETIPAHAVTAPSSPRSATVTPTCGRRTSSSPARRRSRGT
jgi:nicotinamidase-related amidase